MEFETTTSVMQAKMANTNKAIGEDMRKETTNELGDRQFHNLLFTIVTVIEILEGDGILGNRHNTMIGNGNAEDVATEIFEEFLFVVEWLLDIDFPIFGKGFGEHSLDIQGAIVGIEFAASPEFGEFKAEAVAEHIGKQENGEEKLVRSGIPGIASGGGNQCAASHDEVDMEMLLQGLTPSVHDHREANVPTEILLPELLQQLSSDFDEEIEEEFLIESHQVIENMVDGEDDMEILDGQDPFLLVFEPLCFLERAAFWAMTILARLITEFPLPTLLIVAPFQDTAECGSATI